MTSAVLTYRSHSCEKLPSPKSKSTGRLRSSRSACTIDQKLSPSPSGSSSSLFFLDNEIKNENLICSSSLASRTTNADYFHKSNSLDSGYKTSSAASHGTSHTDTIDEENERHENFIPMASSPSSCSSSSFHVVSNTAASNQKIHAKIEFVVDDEDDDVDEKQVRLSRKNSRSNADGKRTASLCSSTHRSSLFSTFLGRR